MRHVRAARDAGALMLLPLALHTLAGWHVRAGKLAAAEMLLAEADSIMAARGDPLPHGRLILAAVRGGDAQALITASIRDGTERGEGFLVRIAEETAATFYVGLGRYDVALMWGQGGGGQKSRA